MPADARTAMLYGPDLAAALVAVAEDLAGPCRSAGGLFEIDDGAGHHSPADIATAIGAALGRRCRPLEIPPALLGLAAGADTGIARATGRTPRLSRDRARYMAHPDWSVDSKAFRALGLWQPETRLADGMAATALWARARGLL
jgi:nucleoside-diphosphate-sugar epimerase